MQIPSLVLLERKELFKNHHVQQVEIKKVTKITSLKCNQKQKTFRTKIWT